MKKITVFFLSFLMLMSVIAAAGMSVYASDSSDFEYSISGGEVKINGYTGSDTELIIPSEIDGYTVTSISYEALADKIFVSITIPKTVKNIGEYAFANDTRLTAVTFEEGSELTSIGSFAFDQCHSLQTITLPDGLTEIGEWAFSDCWDLTEITIPETVASIGTCAFIYCESLQDIYFGGTQAQWDKFGFSEDNYYDEYIFDANLYLKGTTKHDHTIKNYITKATSSSNGKIVKKCSVCGYTTSTSTLYAISSVSLSKTSYVYTGKAITPSISVKNSKGNKISSAYYTIKYIDRSTGKTVSSAKKVGKYYVKITFNTRYNGSIKKAFKIVPKATKISSLTAVSGGFKVKWSKVTSCTDGYQIQYSTSKKFTNATTKTITKNTTTSKKYTSFKGAKKYYVRVRTYKKVKVDGKSTKYYSSWTSAKSIVTLPKATKLSSVSYSSKGTINVKWKTRSDVNGYVIQYSTSKSFSKYKTSSVFISSKKTSSKKISGLGGTTYYVRIGTYKTLDGKKYISDWSSVKSVKVKKGMSVKEMLNAMSSTTKYKAKIKKLTNGSVDVSKYKTTYDRVMAIYKWHAKNNTIKNWQCNNCNSNFNECLYYLFCDTKPADTFLIMYGGYFKNSDGSQAMHKWSVIYLAGCRYYFDPRLQGYLNVNGTQYFGITSSSKTGKKYHSDGEYMVFNSPKTISSHVLKSNSNSDFLKLLEYQNGWS